MMWSKYAAGGNGICVEFNLTKTNQNKEENLSSSKDDKERISSGGSITNLIINIYGNVDNTPIQQGTNKSSHELS